MEEDRWLKIAEVLDGHGAKTTEGDFLFVRSKLGSGKELKFAVPASEAGKLAELAFQSVPARTRHPLIEVLFCHLNGAIPASEDENRTLTFGTDWIEVGVDDDGIVALTLGFQERWRLSFRLSRRLALWATKNLDDAYKGRLNKPESPKIPQHPFLTIAEDIEWFRDDWVARVAPPTDAELRRASGTLRHLLINNGLHMAWRHCGFKGGPRIIGPDLEALMLVEDHKSVHSLITLAGGIQVDGIESSFMTMHKAHNPETGKGPEAEEGFAVEIGMVSRKVEKGEVKDSDPRWSPIRHEWRSVERYMKAPGAIMHGQPISRHSILTYFANFNGGVHLDRAKGDPEAELTYRLHQALDGRVNIYGVDGLHCELLAMGQAIGNSPDLILLAKEIRDVANRNAVDFQGVGFVLKVVDN